MILLQSLENLNREQLNANSWNPNGATYKVN